MTQLKSIAKAERMGRETGPHSGLPAGAALVRAASVVAVCRKESSESTPSAFSLRACGIKDSSAWRLSFHRSDRGQKPIGCHDVIPNALGLGTRTTASRESAIGAALGAHQVERSTITSANCSSGLPVRREPFSRWLTCEVFAQFRPGIIESRRSRIVDGLPIPARGARRFGLHEWRPTSAIQRRC